MNIIITSLLTASLLVIAPGCARPNCKATYIDPVDLTVRTEEIASEDMQEVVSVQNIKC